MKRHEISIGFQTDKTAQHYIALAQLVNQYDFDAISVYCDLPYHPGYAALLLMAPHIQRARLGVAANPPARVHPVDIAAQAALLHDLAPGRVFIGLARGAWLEDHALREPLPAVQAMREAAAVIDYLLTGKTGGLAGQIYPLAAHVRAPYPLPGRRLPLLIGTWGQQMAALAGEMADEVKIGGSANPAIVPVMQQYIAVGERVAGRALGTVGVVIGAVSVIDEDRQLARATARRAVALYLPVVAALDPTVQVEPELIAQVRQYVNQGDPNAAAALISDDLLDQFALAGAAPDIIAHSERLFAAGARRIEFGTPHGLPAEKGIRILGKQVIPALRHNWS